MNYPPRQVSSGYIRGEMAFDKDPGGLLDEYKARMQRYQVLQERSYLSHKEKKVRERNEKIDDILPEQLALLKEKVRNAFEAHETFTLPDAPPLQLEADQQWD